MNALTIDGGVPLSGTFSIGGAKNAALPACVASLLTDEPVTLHAVPQLRDVSTILYTLGALGKRVVRHDDNVCIASGERLIPEANAYAVRQMRASFLVLGPLVARLGRAVVPLPGGCAIGARPVDLHLEGLRALGAHVEERDGVVVVTAPRLRGTSIRLPFPSVGATEQLVMAASLAEGVTTIRNAAIEPEVGDLIELLRTMGAPIDVQGRDVRVQGRRTLGGSEHILIPDRIEAGTFLMAGAITGGHVRIAPARSGQMREVLDTLEAVGCRIVVQEDEIEMDAGEPLRAVRVETAPYPGFPTDLHPQLAALLCRAAGTSTIRETVFERRFAYTAELSRMGASMVQDGSTLRIEGGRALRGDRVEAPDIRGGAALVLAGLAAAGRTVVTGLDHIDRGHDDLAGKLAKAGARIERRDDEA